MIVVIVDFEMKSKDNSTHYFLRLDKVSSAIIFDLLTVYELFLMPKTINDLTKKDWDTLFPIELVDHDSRWKLVFKAEAKTIQNKIGDHLIALEHVGSTSIPNIKSKDYIDISIEIKEEDLFSEALIEGMQQLGYHYFRQQSSGADYMIFVKGYRLDGTHDQVFHVHMCPRGHEMLRQINFRDYLKAHPEWAKQYEQLKLELATNYKNDRSGYRIAKSEFIQETYDLINKRE